MMGFLLLVCKIHFMLACVILTRRAEPKEPRERNGQTQDGVSKHQAVLALDMAAWQELIEVFNITEPMIPHREEEEESRSGTRGWYN
jgi:hypothetical protein